LIPQQLLLSWALQQSWIVSPSKGNAENGLLGGIGHQEDIHSGLFWMPTRSKKGVIEI
jgi:hypothetical protein